MALKLKHYTYKVTFPGMPWFYWGVHTDNGKPYFGSPCTHKWIWDFYEFEVQILEWFVTREEAEKAEDRLIKWFWDDPNCLNEHYGSHFSQEGCRRGVQTQKEAGMGIFGEHQPWRAEASSKAVEKMKSEGTGLFDVEVKRLGGIAAGKANVESGHIQGLGRVQGAKMRDSGALAKISRNRPEELKQRLGREMGKKYGSSNGKRNINKLRAAATTETCAQGGRTQGGINSKSGHMRRIQKTLFMDPDHPELGIHNAGNLVRKQKARGYPYGKENRVKVEKEDKNG
jgi:hypothetical protein